MTYCNNAGETGKYIVQELCVPDEMGEASKLFYKTFATRILWMDSHVVPGAFQMNTAWWSKPQPRDPLFEGHVHTDYDEILGFIGSDPDKPYALNGVIEITIDGNIHRLDRSTMIFVPAGISHNPLRLLEVAKPIFHFSVINHSVYSDISMYNTNGGGE
jgi:hypothetical protein